MTYVDGFVIAVPTENKAAYEEHATKASAVLKEHGALKLVECWGDDVPKGEVTDFYGAVKANEDETIVFAWLTWPDKATRDAAVPKIMTDPRMQPDTNPMPFDGKRMIFGGFEILLDS